MRIVHVTKYFSASGGIESYTRTLSAAAIRAGHSVAVVCSSGTKKRVEQEEKKIKVVALPEFAAAMNAPITKPMIAVLDRLRPDVIHLHMPNPWAELNVFSYKIFRPKTKLVVTYHSDVVPYSLPMKLLSALRLFYLIPSMNFLCNRIIATSDNYVSGSLTLRLCRGKVVVIPLGVDTKKFRPGKKRRGKFTFLFVGRLIPYKGLENLVEACKIMKLSGKDFVLNIVGAGRLYGSLRKTAASLGLGDRIKFFTGIDDRKLPEFYKNCDVFVLPSVYKSEAFGLTQLEAMASGKPVVSTDIKGSGVSFANKHGVTGLVVSPKDDISLANALMRLIDDSGLRKKLGINARKRVTSLFDSSKISKRVLKLYE